MLCLLLTTNVYVSSQNVSDDMGTRMTSGPSLYGELTTEHPQTSRMLDESIVEGVDDEDNYRYKRNGCRCNAVLAMITWHLSQRM